MRGLLSSLPVLLVAGGALASSVESRSLSHDAWEQFATRHPGWTVRWSEEESVHRAFGGGIAVTGPVTSSTQAATAALRFLRDHDSITRAAQADLRVDAAVKRGHVWYVHLRQWHEGLPLLFDDVTVRLWEDGRVFVFGSEVRERIDLDVRPRLSAVEARAAAMGQVERFDAARDEVGGGEDLYVLPPQQEGDAFRLVRRVLASQFDPRHEWILYVDAHTGEVAWRMDRVRTALVRGRVRGETHAGKPSDPLTPEAIPYAAVRVDDVDVVADAAGSFRSHDVTGVVDVDFELRGPYGIALRADQPDVRAAVSFRLDVSFGSEFDFVWDDTNSLADERDAFTHAMHTYQHLKTLDPSTKAMDYVMPVRVNVQGECNAYWDGTGINFFPAGGPCNSTAQIFDVVAHEYAHGINDKIYQSVGSVDGMISAALHEGLADVTAALLTDDPIIGEEFRTDGSYIRNLDNDNRYSRDAVRESHHDGLIVGGAMWELRERIGLETAQRLAHQARYGAPDAGGYRLDEAFGEYLLEVLVADDDDGDLGNGTPHSSDILASFALRGVFPSLAIVFSDLTAHDVEDAATPVRITVNALSSSRDIGVDPTSLKVHYRVNRSSQERTADMHPLAGGNFQALLPVLDPGTVVQYWLEGALIDFEPVVWPHDERAPRPLLLVGQPTVLVEDDFTTDQGWSIDGDPGADAAWERAVPELVRVVSGWPRGDAQPAGDHTFGYGVGPERMCFVTGASHVLIEEEPEVHDPFAGEVDGITRLISPTLDLAGLRSPVVEFYWWFCNNYGGARHEDAFVAEISNDDGQSWTSLFETTVATTAPALRADNSLLADYAPWRRGLVRVRDYLEPTSQVRLRFTVSDQGDESVVEALLDDFRVLEFADAVPVAVSAFEAVWRRDHVALAWTQNGAGALSLRGSDGLTRWDVPLGTASHAIDDSRRWRPGATVRYELRAPVVGVLAAATIEIPAVETTRLLPPSPNPFNPRVTVAFEVARRSQVTLSIVDAAGRRVRRLVAEVREPGIYRENWPGDDDHGRPVASGVYTAVLDDGVRRSTRKLTLVR